MSVGHLVEVPKLQQDFRVLRLQAESLQVSRFRLRKVPGVFVHVTALEKEKDVNIRRRGAQSPVIEFGGNLIFLAISGRVRKTKQFAL